MGQSNTKVRTSKVHTQTGAEKHRNKKQKGSKKKPNLAATVSFNIDSGSQSGEDPSQSSGLHEVADREAIIHSPVEERYSAIILSEHTTPSSTLDPAPLSVATSNKATSGLDRFVGPIAIEERPCEVKGHVPLKEVTSSIQEVGNGALTNKLTSEDSTSLKDPSIKETEHVKQLFANKQSLKALTNIAHGPVKPNSVHSAHEASTILPVRSTPQNQSFPIPFQEDGDSHTPAHVPQSLSPLPLQMPAANHPVKPDNLSPLNKEGVNATACSSSFTDLATELNRPKMLSHSESQHLIGERVSGKRRSILLHMPKLRKGKPSIGRRTVRFEELTDITLSKSSSMNDLR